MSDEEPALSEEQVLRDEYVALGNPAPSDEDLARKSYRHIFFEANRSALCLSGGGIRSAAFSLGILQGLARLELLGRFNYLSTVSGGGYIGSWLTAWRHRFGLKAVLEGLCYPAIVPGPLQSATQSPAAIRNLRGGSSYLAPRAGVFGLDIWTDIVLYLRNLFLTDLLIVPLLCALLCVPKMLLLMLPEFHLSVTDASIGVGAVLILAWAVLARRRPSWARRSHIKDSSDIMIPEVGASLLAAASIGGAIAWATTLRSINLTSPSGLLFCMPEGWLNDACVHAPGPLAFAILGAAVAILATLLGALVSGIAKPGDQATQGVVVSERPILGIAFDMGALMLANSAAGATFGVLAQFLAQLLARGVPLPVQIWITVFPGTLALCVFISESLYLGLLTRRPVLKGMTAWNDQWGDEEREWTARVYAVLAMTIAAWTVLCLVGFFATPFWEWIFCSDGWKSVKIAVTAITGAVSGLGSVVLGASSATKPDGSTAKGAGSGTGKSGLPLRQIMQIAAPVFLIVILSGLSVALDRALFSGAIGVAGIWWAIALLVGVPSLLAFRININRYSLHDLYRHRLTREFLGATHKTPSRDRWTGFDADDDIKLWEIWPPKKNGTVHDAMPEGEAEAAGDLVLYPILNVALNTLAKTSVQTLQREAESFIFSPLFSGNRNVQYRRSETYSDGMRLGTAMAISGAAVSPNAGYSTLKGVSFLLAMFNVRLGVWAANPSQDCWRSKGPGWSIRPLLSEATSSTTDTAKFVYLTDGGHFDNLGVYEMLKRRCRYIVVSDASEDSNFTFEDLGITVRRANVDLGIQIDFGAEFDLEKRNPVPFSKPYCAVGSIYYPESNEDGEQHVGRLLYIKAGYHGKDEPMDVRAFAASNPNFPHDPTTNQFFDEKYFESYRALGLHIVESVLAAPAPGLTIERFVEAAAKMTPASAAANAAANRAASSAGTGWVKRAFKRVFRRS